MTIFPSEYGEPVQYRENGSKLLLRLDIDVQLSLSRTCRQIYSEASLIFYRDNTFFFHYPTDFPSLRDGLRNVQFEAIRYVQASTYFLEQIYHALAVEDMYGDMVA
jgi:hypothetical protein